PPVRHDPRHIPVLLGPVLDALDPKPGQTVVDCTLGLGGHSAAMLRRVHPGGRVIGIDLDPANLAAARDRLAATAAELAAGHPSPDPASPPPATFDLFHNNFAALPTVLTQAGALKVHGILADVGVASTQIDDPDRGFSYRRPGPLDMRMDTTRGKPASVLVNTLGERELAAALRDLGDEDDADKIARLIVERRARVPITTTQHLTKVVCDARDFTLERAAGAKLHPAARTFQALRILVNRELANLQRLLAVLPAHLAPGGVAAIISFHSGEDRLVKDAFRTGVRTGAYAEASPDPVIADDEEREANPRSRSAKLRWARAAD
ncbi:MAG TPA: 16S rRNA (cytosine(1402)-N(4))-methyltransferase RsmH, partial [Humisphaera sp.]